MPVGPYFRIGYAVLLLFLIIYLGTLIDFLFQPVVITVKTLFPPIVLSGVLYYLCRPLVRVLHAKLKLPEGIAILAIYAGTAGLFVLFIVTSTPTQKLTSSCPCMYELRASSMSRRICFPSF